MSTRGDSHHSKSSRISRQSVVDLIAALDKLSTVHVSSGLVLLVSDLSSTASATLSVNGSEAGEANGASADRRSCFDFRIGHSASRIWVPYAWVTAQTYVTCLLGFALAVVSIISRSRPMTARSYYRIVYIIFSRFQKKIKALPSLHRNTFCGIRGMCL
jgi:hypothetical protein